MDQYRYDAVLKAVAGGQSYPDLQVTTRPRVHRRGQPLCGFEQLPAPTAAQSQPQADKQCSYTVTCQMERGRFGIGPPRPCRIAPNSWKPSRRRRARRFDVLDGPARARGIVPARCCPQICSHEITPSRHVVAILVIPTLITAVCA